MTEERHWQPIETAPKNNTSFDVEAEAPNGMIYIIEKCRYVNMFGRWEIWGEQNRVSPYFEIKRWSPRVQNSDTGAHG